LESVEIAVVAVTLGIAAGEWPEAVGGALVAAVGLVAFAFWLRAPLARVPVKPTKFFAAALLMGFGTYWLGEGLGYGWPGGTLAVLWLPLLWGLLMALAATVLRRRSGTKRATPIR